MLHGVGLGLFRDVDVVIGCLDNREARFWVNRSCCRVGTPWIDGAIQEINGIVRVFTPPVGPCYECGMNEVDYQLINVRYSCPLLKREDIAAGRAPTTPTIAAIVAGWQVQEAIKLLHGISGAAGSSLVFNGLSNQFYCTQLQEKPGCLAHDPFDEIHSLGILSSQTTADDLFSRLRQHLNRAEPMCLMLDRDLVLGFHCEPCGAWRETLRPVQSVSQSEATCSSCGTVNRPEMCHVVDADSDFSGRTLSQLGVPPYDIVRVRVGDSERFVLLDGDRLDP